MKNFTNCKTYCRLILVVGFVFAFTQLKAADYLINFDNGGGNVTPVSITVPYGSTKNFEINRVSSYIYARWYIDGSWVEDDNSGIFGIDPDLDHYFGCATPVEVKCRIYNNSSYTSWNSTYIWNVTVSGVSPGSFTLFGQQDNCGYAFIDWTNSSGATGYTVKRNGSTIATLSSSTTQYTDYGLSGGTYTYCVMATWTVCSNYGTQGCVDVDVASNPNANATTTSHTSCGLNNGSVTASGGSSYSWSGGLGSGATHSNVPAGTYTVTVTNSSGCTDTDNTTVNSSSPANANATTTSHTSCGLSNGSVTASGGSSYSWSGGLGSGATHSNVPAGTYTVTVTNSSGCTDTDNTTVNSSSPANANATTVQHNTLCNGCNGSITATGGNSYSWSNGLGSGAAQSNVCAGTYTVTVTDVSGCTDTDNTTVNNNSGGPTSLNSDSEDDNGSCEGTATVSPIGGTSPYSYLWSNSCSTNSCSNLCAGTYYVTVTDANNCSITGSVTINPNAVEEISFINLLTIFPNPNTGAFIIEMEVTEPNDMVIKLYNVAGQIIYEEKLNKYIGTYQKTIDLSKQAKGIYNLQLITKEGSINEKVIIQ